MEYLNYTKQMLKEYSHNIFVIFYLSAQFLFRTILCIWALFQGQISFTSAPFILGAGLVSDIISSFFALPIIILFQRLNLKLSNSLSTVFSAIGYFIFSYIIISSGICQIIFWDEFGSNFNFIAVDYLVYTHEIIGTLQESLPLYLIIPGVLLLISVVSLYSFRKSENFIKPSYMLFFVSLICLITIGKIYDSEKFGPTSNNFAHEISKNGPYEFLYAFYNNSLDYTKFYPLVGSNEALKTVRDHLSSNNSAFLNDETIERNITSNTEKQPYNVVLITVESLSAEYMMHFGNEHNLTPNLDMLADEGMFFTKIYATGTRTVRGLEALSLAVPPLPGASIIRRSDNGNLFTIGTPLTEHGYATDFFYGGYSYFDNLYNFYSKNHFTVIDRSDLKNDEITSENIWGVADEDMFTKSLSVMDKHYNKGEKFFSLIMTTTNHRPYTFPEGRIDVPPGSRWAAVKYTDYAIGKFIEDAKSKAWFKNTIFVITADHCASSAGKTKLPVSKYHIPLIIYAPHIIKPSVNNNLASQIDVPPTILSLLNLSYRSKFFGQDLISSNPNRAFISTYQLLGYLKDDILVVLGPKTNPVGYRINSGEQILMEPPEALTSEAVSYYQLFYDLFKTGKMKAKLD